MTDLIKAVGRHLDAVLDMAGNARYAAESPLIADFIDFDAAAPPEHVSELDGKTVVVSDFAHQQNLMRTLCLYSDLTGDPVYRARAEAMYRFHFDNLLTDTGLFRWGGHLYVDLKTLTGNGEKDMVHELKNDFPFYELMFEVCAEKAEGFVKAFWNSHIYDWYDFEMGRHSRENGRGTDGIWEREFGDPPPFCERAGLSFMNTGNDLLLAACNLFMRRGDHGAMLWAKRLHGMYVKSRHKSTGLGVYQFTKPLKRYETDDFSITLSYYGDRAERQLGPELGPDALEGNMLLPGQANTIYGINPQILARLAQHGGEHGIGMINDAANGLKAFARHAYVPESNEFRPLLADGKDLTGFIPARPGYYSAKQFTRHFAGGRFLLSYGLIALLAGDNELWQTAVSIAKGLNLGDIGDMDGSGAALNTASRCSDAAALMALLSMYASHGNCDFIALADKIAQNIAANHTINCIFTRQTEFAAYRMHIDGCGVDSQDPFALLALEAIKAGKANAVPFAVY